MNIEKVNEIKDLISKCEIESAKAQGIIENIKNQWKEEFGTDDEKEVEQKLQDMKSDLEQSNERLENLYNKLVSSYDWEQLEEEMGQNNVRF